MKKPTIAEMQALIAQLRSIAPNRALTYGESLQVGRVQAAKLRRWAHADEPDINLAWLVLQRAIPVNLVPSHRLREESGLTTDLVSHKLEIFINQSEPDVRQRFSLLHEFKHALDWENRQVLHTKLGSGNEAIKNNLIEAIANDFAAHVLMPTGLMKREWFAWRDVPTVANIFNVSAEAATRRLEKLGILGEEKPMPRVYFRHGAILPLAA
jgi:Zn-dependent peptidase ImmA (M78 family)